MLLVTGLGYRYHRSDTQLGVMIDQEVATLAPQTSTNSAPGSPGGCSNSLQKLVCVCEGHVPSVSVIRTTAGTSLAVAVASVSSAWPVAVVTAVLECCTIATLIKRQSFLIILLV
jgi:hypothetical protein